MYIYYNFLFLPFFSTVHPADFRTVIVIVIAYLSSP